MLEDSTKDTAINAATQSGQPLAVVVSALSLALDGMQVRERGAPDENKANDVLEQVVQESGVQE